MAGRYKFTYVAFTKRCALVLAALYLVSCAPTLSGKLEGQTSELSPSEARVNVTRLDGEKGAEPRTIVIDVEPNGEFSTDEDLPEGSYLVEALVPGYKLVSERVEINESKEVKFKLTPLSAPKPRAIGTNVDVDMGRGSGAATLTPPNL